MKKEIMTTERLAASMAIPDLTDPVNGIHAINLIADNVKRALESAYNGATIEEIRTDPRVSVAENFDALLFPPTTPEGRPATRATYPPTPSCGPIPLRRSRAG